MTPLNEPTERAPTVSRRTVLRGALATAAAGAFGVASVGTAAGMNKAELIDSIASEADVTETDAKKALNALLAALGDELAAGNRVGVEEFGTLAVRDRAKKHKSRGASGTDDPPGVEFRAAAAFSATVDLVPGAGDTERVESGKKKDKQAGWLGPAPDVLVDAERLVEAANTDEDRSSGSGQDGKDDPGGPTRDPALTKADAKKALDAFVAATGDSLRKGNRVALADFGSFAVSKRSARKGRNPQTGKEIKIPAKKVVKFKPGAELSDKIK
jgi:DNA-binding protein HU-beta